MHKESALFLIFASIITTCFPFSLESARIKSYGFRYWCTCHYEKKSCQNSLSRARKQAFPLFAVDDKLNDTNNPFTTTTTTNDADSLLQQLLKPSSNCDVTQLSPTSLAFLGDSVFELFIRSRYLWPSRRTSLLQKQVVGMVRAEMQSKILKKLTDPNNKTFFHFTPTEMRVLSRGRNTGGSGSSRKHRGPKRLTSHMDGDSSTGSITDYQNATALEALIGYLYISDSNRCYELMHWIKNEIDHIDSINTQLE